jgi:hypothetical protein
MGFIAKPVVHRRFWIAVLIITDMEFIATIILRRLSRIQPSIITIPMEFTATLPDHQL